MPRVYYGTDFDSFRYISHHGILGMKWGIRRFQNKDGSLTAAGKKRKKKEENERVMARVNEAKRRREEREASEESAALKDSLKERGFVEDPIYGSGTLTKEISSSSDKNLKSFTIEVDSSGFKSPLSNNELLSIVDELEGNFQNVSKTLKNRMADAMIRDKRPGWAFEDSGMTDAQIKQILVRNMGRQPTGSADSTVPGYAHFRIMSDGLGEVGYDDGGAFYGHYLISDIDWKTKKVSSPSVNG